jgi:large subunit ribosomal protein L10
LIPKGAKTRNLEEKKRKVSEIISAVNSSNAQFIVNVIGMTAEDVTNLRKLLKSKNAKLQVVKNTLARIAAEECDLRVVEDLFVGPTAVIYSYGDPVEIAKVITKATKDYPKFQIKGGCVNGKALTPKDVEVLSKLPPREVLLAKLLATMKAPLYGFVGVLAGNIKQLIYVLNAIKDRKQEG